MATVRVTTGSDAVENESSITIEPSRGAWIKMTGRYAPVSIFGSRFPGHVTTSSMLASISPATGALWFVDGRKLKGVSRTRGAIAERTILGEAALDIGAGALAVVTAERIKLNQGELLFYPLPDLQEPNIRIATAGAAKIHWVGENNRVIYSTTLGALSTFFEVLPGSEPRELVQRSAPFPNILRLPGDELGFWLGRGHPVIRARDQFVMSPLLDAKYVAVDVYGLWALTPQSARKGVLKRYEIPEGKEAWELRDVFDVDGLFGSGTIQNGQLLASSRSSSVAFVGLNGKQENLAVITPIETHFVKLEKPVETVMANEYDGYLAGSPVWHRPGLAPENHAEKLAAIVRGRQGQQAQLRIEADDLIEENVNSAGRAYFDVASSNADRPYTLTSGDDGDFGASGDFGFKFGPEVAWLVDPQLGAALWGFLDNQGGSRKMRDAPEGLQFKKRSLVSSDNNTIWSDVFGRLTVMDYENKEIRLFEPPLPFVTHDFSQSGEYVWLLLRDSAQTLFKVFRIGPDGTQEGIELDEADSITAFSQDRAIVFGRQPGPNGNVTARAVTADLGGSAIPIRGMSQLSKATTGPNRVWVFGRDQAGRDVFVTMGQNARPQGSVKPVSVAIDRELIAGRDGLAWAFAPAAGITISSVYLWRDPAKEPIKVEHRGSLGMFIIAGKDHAAVVARNAQKGAFSKEFRINGDTLDVTGGRSFWRETLIWKPIDKQS